MIEKNTLTDALMKVYGSPSDFVILHSWTPFYRTRNIVLYDTKTESVEFATAHLEFDNKWNINFVNGKWQINISKEGNKKIMWEEGRGAI